MTSLNISNNNIVSKSPAVHAKNHGLKVGDPVEYEGAICTVSHRGNDGYHVWMTSGIIALANAIRNMGALTKLDISSNSLRPEGGEALALGLKDNQVICELNIADNNLAQGGTKMSGVVALADVIPGMGALSSLNLANNNIGMLVEEDGWTVVSTETYEQGQIVEGNYKQSEKWYPGKITDVKDGTYSITYDDGDAESNVTAAFIKSPEEDKEIQWQHTDGRQQASKPAKAALGVVALANAIPDMGALSIANVMGNHIDKEMLSKLQEIMHSKPNLISLCGIADDATQADLSGLGMDADDAIILASELPDKGALTSLDISNNNIGQRIPSEDWETDGKGWWLHKTKGVDWVKLDGVPAKEMKAVGAIAIANAIKDMRAISTVIVNTFPLPIQDIKSKAELNFSGKRLKVEDTIIIAALVPLNVSRSMSRTCYR
jgi:hypothetical protein